MSINLHRFDRQIALPQVDLDGQESLSKAHVIVIGVGGLGCAAAQSLSLMGIGHLTLVDKDIIELSNLARQSLYFEADIGKAKVSVAAKRCELFNPAVNVTPIQQTFCETWFSELLQKIKKTGVQPIVLDCTDNKATRLNINTACRKWDVNLVIAAAIRFEGMLMCVYPDADTPCYECISKVWPDPNESCVERGVLAPIVSIIGHYQALFAAQLIIGLNALPAGKTLFFDGLSHQWRELHFTQQKSCHTCKQKND